MFIFRDPKTIPFLKPTLLVFWPSSLLEQLAGLFYKSLSTSRFSDSQILFKNFKIVSKVRSALTV